MLSRLFDAHARHILSLEKEAIKALLRVYRDALHELDDDLAALDSRSLGPGQGFTSQHLALIRIQVSQTLDAFARTGGREVDAVFGRALTDGFAQGLAEVIDLERRFVRPIETLAGRLEVIPPVIPARHVGILAQPSNLIVTRAEFIKDDISRSLSQSVLRGESNAKAARRLRTTMKAQESNLERIVVTEINNAANIGHLASIQEVADDFPEMGLEKQWSSHLDARTSKRCEALDGQVRPVDKAFEAPDGWSGMAPAAHPWCRSRVNAYSPRWSGKPARR